MVDLVEKVGRTKIEENSRISTNTIVLDEYEVTFDDLHTEELGTQNIRAVFSDPNVEDEFLKITVVDKTAPIIAYKSENVVNEFTSEEIDSKKYLDLIEVSDNYSDSENIKVESSLSKDDFAVGDNIDVHLEARDENNNLSTSVMKIVVKENEEKEEEEKGSDISEVNEDESISEEEFISSDETINESNPDENINEIFNDSSSSDNTASPVIPNKNKPANRTFLFSSGYDMNSAPAACQEALISSGFPGVCTPIQDSSGIYKGMQLTYH